MHLFLTSVLPLLAHDHASAVAFLTCRHHNFHGSIVPEFLSDDQRVKKFADARPQNQLKASQIKQCMNLYHLFAQTPLMQFSPSLMLRQKECVETILKPFLETKYFTRTLQRCSVVSGVLLTTDLLQSLSKVRSLTKLEIGSCEVENDHMEIIVNSFASIETLTIENARCLDPTTAISISSPPPPVTKTLRSLTLRLVDALFATQFVPHLINLRKLKLSAKNSYQVLDLLPWTSSLPLLTDLSLECFNIQNIESLEDLAHLSTLVFHECCIPDLSFLAQEDSIPELTTLRIDSCEGLSTNSSFATLSHAPNLRVLTLHSSEFNNDCLQYLEDMVHLRKLDLSHANIVGDNRSLKALMQNLVQLEELNLLHCRVGNQGAIAGALYSTHSRLRVLNLPDCNLVDDDLNGIGALKNTLEVLDLSHNRELTNESFVHCKDLSKLKILKFNDCRINDLSSLEDCLNLEELILSCCDELRDDSFKVFSGEPNSFPYLRVLDLSLCLRLTEKVFEHLSKNSHLVYQLKELNVEGVSGILSSPETGRNNICQLKGLRGLYFSISADASREELKKITELTQGLKNLEE